MLKHVTKVFILASLLVLTGCATPISQEAIAHANYGPSPKNYQQLIKNDIGETLIDPTSPLYTFSKPEKGYTAEAPIFGTHESFGWRVCGTINSKNRFGGYTGKAPFFVLFKDGRIVSKVMGEPSDGNVIQNSAIERACSRSIAAK